MSLVLFALASLKRCVISFNNKQYNVFVANINFSSIGNIYVNIHILFINNEYRVRINRMSIRRVNINILHQYEFNLYKEQDKMYLNLPRGFAKYIILYCLKNKYVRENGKIRLKISTDMQNQIYKLFKNNNASASINIYDNKNLLKNHLN